jgi:4-hydroxybenzoate polyprenyltransferase
MQKIYDFIRLMRPKQWFKSFYIVIGAAPAIFLMPVQPFLIFWLLFLGILNMVLIQGVIYAINDIADYESDRKHPIKRFRPIASGKISRKEAVVFALFLFILAAWIAIMIDLRILLIDFALIFLNLIYSFKPFRLRDRMYVDIFSAGLNFPLRVMVGWFLFEPYNEARFTFHFEIFSRYIDSQSIQALLFSAYPRVIETTIKFSTITLSFVSIMFFTYFLACYLLALKRLVEKLEKKESSRIVLEKYSPAKLKAIAINSAIIVFLSYLLLAWSLKPSLLMLLPILFYALLRYYKMSFEPRSIVGKPEEIFRNREFQLLFALTTVSSLILLFFF